MRNAEEIRGTRTARVSSRMGSVLILALWVLFFLAALAVAVGAQVAGAIKLAESLRYQTLGQLMARAGVESAVQSLEGDTNNWDAATEPWGQESRFRDVPLEGGAYSVTHMERDARGGGKVVFGLADEERRINLNLAETNLLESLLHVAGEVDRHTASEIVMSMGRYWTAKSERAAKRDRLLTGKAGSGYSDAQEGANIRFESLPELLLVPGMTVALYEKIAPFCTVYGYGKVNINTAEPTVLGALLDVGMGENDPADRDSLVKAIVAYRESGRVFEARGGGMDDLRADVSSMPGAAELNAALARIRGSNIGVRSSCFGGMLAVRLQGHTADDSRIDFVYERDRGVKVAWHLH